MFHFPIRQFSFDDYVSMFNLTTMDLRQKVVSFADGVSTFNRQASEQGFTVYSVDPLYQLSAPQIQQEFVRQVKQPLSESQQERLRLFIEDYPDGQAQQRFQAGELTQLPLPHQQVGVGLCSHYLFYDEQLDELFYLAALEEMLRVAYEVRVFPLVEADGQPSPHVSLVQEHFAKQGYLVELQQVSYPMLPRDNEMLLIRRA